MNFVTNGIVMLFAAKKQRMVQIMELQDLPKQGPKLFHGRPMSQHHRQWMNNRR
jgi:hypothetical protein